MESRIRAWAATGQYAEEDENALDQPVRRTYRAAGAGQQALVGLLVPIGMVVGVLLAAAVVLRLLSLPFTLAFGSRQREKG